MNTTGSFDWRDESEDHLLFGDSDKDFFFEEGHREQYVQQLLKLSQLEELFVFLLGATGIGKTSVLHEFIRRQSDTADCAYIEVPILADTITLLDDIAKQCDITVATDSDVDQYIYAIRHFIQENYHQERKFILVVDDADGLPDDALRALLKLISKTGAPHFIFSSHDPSLQNRINALVPFYQTHTLDIRPLTEAEVVSYTELYLSAYHLENDFSDDDIYDIFLSSTGNIGEVNKLINAAVDGAMQTDNADYLARTQKISTLQIPRLHIMAVIVAIIGLGALGLYFMNNTTTSTTASTKTLTPTPAATIASAQEDQIVNVVNVSAAAPTTAHDYGFTDTPTPTAPNVTKTPVSTTAPTAATTTTATTLSNGWLATAPATNFTLQMMGSFSKDSVSKLVKRQSNSKEWAIYQTKRDGKAWFVAVYGNYTSSAAAKAAAAKLPAGLKEGKPWPKAISVIHKEMKQ